MEIWFWNETMHFIWPNDESIWAFTAAVDSYPNAADDAQINSVVKSYLREHGVLECVVSDD
jgi:hypothetical protein